MAAGSYFKRWMALALAVCVAAGGGAAAWYLLNVDQAGRPAVVDTRTQGLAVRLKKPQVVSPTEEYFGPDGQIVYLTTDQFRAANGLYSSGLPGYDRKLAAAFAESDPDAQARAFVALMQSVPNTKEADATALSLYLFATSTLASVETPERIAARSKIDDAIRCRFVAARGSPKLPACASRPTFVPSYVLAGISGVALLAVLGALIRTALQRRRANRQDRTQSEALLPSG